MDYKTQISDFIDGKRDEMVDLLQRLASIPSVLGEERENMPYGENTDKALKLAEKEAEKLGLDVNCFENRADLINLNGEKTRLAILCHLDVVPASDEGWTNPPFEPTITGNMIYGRGVSDNKGPAAAALYAMYAIRELGIPLKSNAMLYLGGCEENRCADLKYYLGKNTMPEYAFTPDGAFPVGNAERGRIVVTCNTEFNSDKIISVNAGKGVNIIPDYAVAELKSGTVETFGKSTHSAHPRAGDNALTALLEKLAELDENIKILSDYFPHNVFDGSGLGLEGGLDISLTQLKIKDGKMFFTADGRVDLGVSSKELSAVIEKNIVYPVEMLVKEPHLTDPESDIVKKLNKVYEECTPHKGGTYTLDAMTYAHDIENAVIFGGVLPGDGCCNAHGINECYNLDTLVDSSKIFAAAIIEICGIKGADCNE